MRRPPGISWTKSRNETEGRMKSRHSISRRQFIKTSSAAVLVTPLLLSGQEGT
ncbi:MAG: twin-arginine translocation signal domain-containing protein, partial [Acidobacteriota bacterium]